MTRETKPKDIMTRETKSKDKRHDKRDKSQKT